LKTVQDRAIVTMANPQKVIHGLSNRAIFNALERSQTHISRSDRFLTLNVSEMAKDTAIVTMEGEYETVPKLLNGTIFNDLE